VKNEIPEGGNEYKFRVFACPVGDKVNMLIRQIRSFGSLRKVPVCMPCSLIAGKPEGSFMAPTYTLGGSNIALHGRVGFLFALIAGLVCMISMRLWRTAFGVFKIESNGKITYNIIRFSPPGMSLQP